MTEEGKHSTHRAGDGMGMVMDGLLLPRCHLMESGWAEPTNMLAMLVCIYGNAHLLMGWKATTHTVEPCSYYGK